MSRDHCYLRPSLIRSFRRTQIITLKPSFNLFIANLHVTGLRNSSSSFGNHSGLVTDKSSVSTEITKLEQDLRSLINHPERSDLEILCKDGKKLFGCKAILASRSEIFNRLIYKEGNQEQISFPNIQYSGMENILEYFYTGSIKEILTHYNILETYHAAKNFNLSTIQDNIFNELKNNLENNYKENVSPELLSKALEMTLLKDDDDLLNLLVKAVAIIPLNKIKYGRLSIEGLQYLLHYTHEKATHFATSEYEVLRYSAILAAKQVSNEAYKSIMENFPTLDKAEELIQKWFISIKFYPQDWFITDRRKIARKLEPFIELIEFKRIKKEILDKIIKPLGIISDEIIKSNKEIINTSDSNLNDIRGIPTLYITKSDYTWDELTCSSDLIIKDNGKVVQATKNDLRKNVNAVMAIEKGIFEWEVIIEKCCEYTSIGVSASNFDHGIWAGDQSTGWVLNFNGYCYNSGRCSYYCQPFTEDGTKIIVHLNMDKKTCAFTVNGTRYPEVSEWNNLPSKLYPVVSLRAPAQCRIQPYHIYQKK
ncbi:hypothetical protein RclHR1_00500027 [Rhizophagus clarus]|uniref:BTB domain-containing protein n=1 Tax=Rhizophagus clarus TaxID=94130 RepID=A0A2Z6SE19_9GLOM|nr:hypothetical protein RclHR1_00500027 [Rhizophagus clarus]